MHGVVQLLPSLTTNTKQQRTTHCSFPCPLLGRMLIFLVHCLEECLFSLFTAWKNAYFPCPLLGKMLIFLVHCLEECLFSLFTAWKNAYFPCSLLGRMLIFLVHCLEECLFSLSTAWKNAYFPCPLLGRMLWKFFPSSGHENNTVQPTADNVLVLNLTV